MRLEQVLKELEKMTTQTANMMFSTVDKKTELRDILYLRMVDCLLYEVSNEERESLVKYYRQLRKEVLQEDESEVKDKTRVDKINVNSMF